MLQRRLDEFQHDEQQDAAEMFTDENMESQQPECDDVVLVQVIHYFLSFNF